jgi:hypothetical protein
MPPTGEGRVDFTALAPLGERFDEAFSSAKARRVRGSRLL